MIAGAAGLVAPAHDQSKVAQARERENGPFAMGCDPEALPAVRAVFLERREPFMLGGGRTSVLARHRNPPASRLVYSLFD